MKKIKILSLCLFLSGIMAFFCTCTGPNTDGLPSSAKAFLNKHFEGIAITSVEQDINRDYDVRLENGVEISFERKGNWTEVKAKKKLFPESILQTLPQQMVHYVKTNYPDQSIRKIERKSYGYRISLNKPNNVELNFTRQGAFIKEDAK